MSPNWFFFFMKILQNLEFHQSLCFFMPHSLIWIRFSGKQVITIVHYCLQKLFPCHFSSITIISKYIFCRLFADYFQPVQVSFVDFYLGSKLILIYLMHHPQMNWMILSKSSHGWERQVPHHWLDFWLMILLNIWHRHQQVQLLVTGLFYCEF